MSKYHAQKTVVDGIEFDSKKEAKRWVELKKKQEQGELELLERQVKFVLIPKQTRTYETTRGKEKEQVLERECAYYGDFVYRTPDGELVVEDTKGMKTPEYRIKKKLMLERWGIQITEV